ncbi:P0560B06.2 [Oryza sativa Japonica Group]|uniref:p0560B06.2 protein n=1 Tax=Oryza sativa subsp. japonica TaxID=39947 RepID=Q942U0_ORYSJ|nr:P0560B06.2 [Oryza sativa Japonica Group]
MDYISPDRSLEGACGDPGPLFGDHDGSLLEHMGFHGDPQHVSPQLNEGLLVDSTDQISYLAADSPSFMNDQIPCNTMKSASTSPASPLKQADDHHVHIDSDMENDAAEQNLHDSYSEAQTTSLGYGIHRRTEVADAAQPTELHESNGNNDTSNFQEETTQSDTYLGDAMLNENGSRDYQLNNSGADDDEIPNSPALEMEDVDTRALHETSHDEKYEAEDDQMNGEGTHQGGHPHQGEEIHQGGTPHQGEGTHQGGPPHQGEGTHQEGTPHQGGGTPHEGGTGQNQGHLRGKLMALDIEGNMVDLGQGLLTQGVTIGDLQEGIHHGADHLLPVIVIIHLEGRGHHLPTGRLDWVSLDGICLLQVLVMPPLSEIWKRNSLSMGV